MSDRIYKIQEIKDLLNPYNSSQTECDGMTRICHTVLSQHNIEHQPMIGDLIFNEEKINPHLWIDLPSGDRIDYRARMWLNNSAKVPHGVFHPFDFPDVIYEGEPVELELLPPALLTIMTLQFDFEKP